MSGGIDKRPPGKNKAGPERFLQAGADMIRKKSLIVDDDALIRLSRKNL